MGEQGISVISVLGAADINLFLKYGKSKIHAMCVN